MAYSERLPTHLNPLWLLRGPVSPRSGLLRQDTITLNPATQQPLVNASAVESCPDDTNYAQIAISGG